MFGTQHWSHLSVVTSTVFTTILLRRHGGYLSDTAFHSIPLMWWLLGWGFSHSFHFKVSNFNRQENWDTRTGSFLLCSNRQTTIMSNMTPATSEGLSWVPIHEHLNFFLPFWQYFNPFDHYFEPNISTVYPLTYFLLVISTRPTLLLANCCSHLSISQI